MTADDLDALPLDTWIEVTTQEGETFRLVRCPGGWYLPGDVVIASGDIIDPARVRTLSCPNEAKRLANAQLKGEGHALVASHATRQRGVWVVSYVEAEHPGELLCGGGLVVTDEREVLNLGSAPGSLAHLLGVL